MIGFTSVLNDFVPSQVGVVIVPPPALLLLQAYKIMPVITTKTILFMVSFFK
jgi:hypothetical protein